MADLAWLIVVGIVLFALAVLALHSFGSAGDANDDSDSDAPEDYQWGDELHEYSYRHPWEDEI